MDANYCRTVPYSATWARFRSVTERWRAEIADMGIVLSRGQGEVAAATVAAAATSLTR
jgi:hypothetical protein